MPYQKMTVTHMDRWRFRKCGSCGCVFEEGDVYYVQRGTPRVKYRCKKCYKKIFLEVK